MSPALKFGLLSFLTLASATSGNAATPSSAHTIARKLLTTTIDPGNVSAFLNSGYTTIDQTTVNCAQSVCTIGFQVMASLGNNSLWGNTWAICGLVDGAFNNFDCPTVGDLPTDGSSMTGNYRQSFTVTKGLHTVSVVLYVTTGGPVLAGTYEADYLLYAL